MSHPDVRMKEKRSKNQRGDRFLAMRNSPIKALAYLLQPLLRSRDEIMSRIGTSFGGKRKLYEAFGWPTTPDYDYYRHLYDRGGIARRLVAAYPYATWHTPPELVEEGKDSEEETEFEKAWKELCKQKRLFHYLERVDRMARLGEFAVLFIGYNDGSDYDRLKEPVGAVLGTTPTDKLLYLQPYSEKNCSVSQWEENTQDPRFGLPFLYTITLESPLMGKGSRKGISRTVEVHHSRILHVAEDVLDNDSQGTPALKPVLNMLLDLEKVLGSASEAFFQQTPPGTIFNTPPNASPADDTDDEIQTKIDNFIHGYQRYLVTHGMDIHSIASQIGDPTKIYSCIIELLAGTTGIPKRILVGSERGELSSEQDETNWNNRIEERQTNWAEPFVLTPFVDELIAKGVLPPPVSEDGYSCNWKSQHALGEQVKAEISDKKSAALQKYCSTPDAESIVPPRVFLEEIMNFSPEVCDKIEDMLGDLWDKEQEDLRKSEEELAQEELKKREILGEGPERPPVAPGGGSNVQ